MALRRFAINGGLASAGPLFYFGPVKGPMIMKHFLLSLGLICWPLLGAAHDYRVGDLVIDHPIAHETIKSAMTGAGYFNVTNNGDIDDRLLSVTADFPRVMMHDTFVTDGIATMTHLADGIVVPAGGTISFSPGGRHVMFMGLKGDPFEIGEEIPATMTFQNAGDVAIVFNVEAMATTHDH